MAFFEWKDEYGVNIREIDLQHQKLVSLLNELHMALMRGEGREATFRILTELVDYTKMHFATEERLMQAHGYPDYALHKGKHEKMAEKVLDYVEKYRTEKLATAIELKEFLKNWLTRHILQTDKAYAPFLNGKGVR